MKLMICGKGGSGKSTIAALLAKEMIKRDYRVLLVDADESNIGLYQMLGLVMPQSLLADLGGKKGFNEKLKASRGQGLMAGPQVFKPMDLDSLPSDCTASSGNLHLVSTGKIHHLERGVPAPWAICSGPFSLPLN
jgi:CO dehydrogenase maturation factor